MYIGGYIFRIEKNNKTNNFDLEVIPSYVDEIGITDRCIFSM